MHLSMDSAWLEAFSPVPTYLLLLFERKREREKEKEEKTIGIISRAQRREIFETNFAILLITRSNNFHSKQRTVSVSFHEYR